MEFWGVLSTPSLLLLPGPLTLSSSTCLSPFYESNRTVWKLLVLDRNTWNLITVCKQMIIIETEIVTWNYIIVYKLLVLDKNTWNHTIEQLFFYLFLLVDVFESCHCLNESFCFREEVHNREYSFNSQLIHRISFLMKRLVSWKMTLNCIWWWGSCSGTLGNVESAFFAISSCSTLILIGSIGKDQIFELNRSVWKLFVFNWTVYKKKKKTLIK